MARVAFSAIIAGARGKLAGVVFSANGSGPYMKSWSRSPRKTSDTLQAARSFMSSHGNEWAALSQSDRDDWDTWAALPAQELEDAFGESYYASGWNWYVTINQRNLLIDRPLRDTFPSVLAPAAPTINSIVWSTSNDGQLTINYPASEFNNFGLVALASLRPATGRSVDFLSQALTVGRDKNGLTSSSVVFTDINEILGTVQSGNRGFVWVYKQHITGPRSPAVELYAQVP